MLGDLHVRENPKDTYFTSPEEAPDQSESPLGKGNRKRDDLPFREVAGTSNSTPQ
jgi:hypothetical protein